MSTGSASTTRIAISLAILVLATTAIFIFLFPSETFAWDEEVALPGGASLKVHRVQTNKGRVPVNNPQHALTYFSHHISWTLPGGATKFDWTGTSLSERLVAIYLDGRGPVLVTLLWVNPKGQTGYWYREYLGLGGDTWTLVSESQNPGYKGAYDLLEPQDAIKYCAPRMAKEVLKLEECISPLKLKLTTPSRGIFDTTMEAKQ